MKIFVLPVAAVCLAVSIAMPAAAQTAIDPLVKTLLDEATTMMRAEGMSLVGDYRAGSLRDGANASLQIELQGGRSYVIAAACDNDCDDVDLLLADSAGEEMDSDYLPDDFPMVQATVTRTGTYQVTVSMASCSIEPCGYGVAVYTMSQ